ncbi:MAG: diacylglycerol kinase family protein [Flavobacteriales bacterium]
MSLIKNTDKYSIGKKWKSFTYALSGLRAFAREEHNLWLYVGGVLGSLVLGFIFNISHHEWLVQSVVTTLICSAELMNTAIENVVDLVSSDFHPLAKNAKDVASAAVLITALGGLVIFLLIYGPRFLAFVL